MFQLHSFRLTFTIRFAVILVPLLCLLGFQAERNASRGVDLGVTFRRHELAQLARDQYRIFLSGAEDAVDTGRLSSRAVDTLLRSSSALDELASDVHAETLSQTAISLAKTAARLASDPGLGQLEAMRPAISTIREALLGAETEYSVQADETIRNSIAEAKRDTWAVGILSLVLLLLIARLVRDLTRPLNLAVSVANRIANGVEVGESETRGQPDIGRLLHSLGKMNGALRNYRTEIEASRSRLEKNVRELQESQDKLAQAQQLAQLGSWYWDCGSETAHFSDEMYTILDLDRGESEPTMDAFLNLLEPDDRRVMTGQLEQLKDRPGSHVDELHLRRRGERNQFLHHRVSSCTGAANEVVRVFGVFQDITERKTAEDKIRRLANFDSLTGLANRPHFLEHLDHLVARARRESYHLATLFIDLDRFKRVNDTMGHAAGDALLREVALRLDHCVRQSDSVGRDSGFSDALDGRSADAVAEHAVARLGGDEFIVALVAFKRPLDAAMVARRILIELARPFEIEGTRIVVTASVGIALYPTDGATADTLIKNADVAMYRAKEIGKNTFQFFAEEMNRSASAKMTLESELRIALESDQFVLHYQPKVAADSGIIVGVEALIRWNHPQRGLIAPDRFIPLAEEAGLISAIGDWVLDHGCRQLRLWRDAGLPPISLAINLAGASFRESDLVARVEHALQIHDLAPGLLQLEATESMMMSDVEHAMVTLNNLRRIGVKLSIDDFGTGYSSLSYLRRFPIDQLKVDRSFVVEMTESADAAAIVAAIVSLGRNLALEVVAEGVETCEQADRLRELGCHVLQGYYFSRPVPAQNIPSLLRNAPFRLRTHESTGPSQSHDSLQTVDT